MKTPPLLLAVLLLAASLRADEPPRLAVMVAVDQMRADYLVRFRPWFVEGGFRRLLEDGAVYTNAHHRHALTTTAAGHATVSTGVHANLHGIAANEWFDFPAGRVITAVHDPKSPLVGAARAAVRLPGGALDSDATASPARLHVPTVGDQLKLRYGSQVRVIGLANKDRGAIFLSGKLADGVYWFHEGRLVTSSYYRADLPGWLTDFLATDPIGRRFGQTWDRLLAKEIYDQVQGPDEAAGEEEPYGLGQTFPRRVDGGQKEPGSEFHNAYRLDPHCTEVLGEAVARAVAGEQLGRHAAPDLLCVSFSQPDYCGHSFGPDSHEIMDSILRLDRVLAAMMEMLDREVGRGRWTLVLTADHGVAPLPERVAATGRGLDAGRMDYAGLTKTIEAALTAAFGAPPTGLAWVLRDGYGYRLWPATIEALKIDPVAARQVVKAAALAWPQTGFAWTREELLGDAPPLRDYLAEWRLSYHPALSQDVILSPKPYVVDRKRNGTNHGTPYEYDTHLPLLWYGAGVTPGVHEARVGSDAIAPTLAKILGIPRPPQAHAQPLF